MKNNNIIQEEINRAKQLWGYDTSKTLVEQTTGNTGTSSSCLAVSQRTMCTGTTHTGGYVANTCATIDGQPLTQNDVGSVVRFTNNISADNLQFTIDQVQGINLVGYSNGLMDFISDVCPTTNTGTTGGPYPNGTPCYACINNQIESVLFPSNALGQPYPSCAPTAYGYQGQPNGLPGGAASYAYPSIWSEVQPTNCGNPPPRPNTSCNKSCQQLVPNFKNKAQGKPCNWLNNRLNAFTNKLATKTPGTCAHKRIECKIGVVQALLQQNGC
tara:strand:+ start:78 stop:890 length:813 start_codon:yes stop_codon:yes gene_type:complete